jgi:DNA-binding transcriptional ArsR family regulator
MSTNQPFPGVANAAGLSRALVALGDPTRQAILTLLSREQLTVNELSERFDLSRPAVSHHLKVLLDAALLRRERRGRERLYRVDAAACRDFAKRLGDFVEVCCSGRQCC